MVPEAGLQHGDGLVLVGQAPRQVPLVDHHLEPLLLCVRRELRARYIKRMSEWQYDCAMLSYHVFVRGAGVLDLLAEGLDVPLVGEPVASLGNMVKKVRAMTTTLLVELPGAWATVLL